jgi:hypothetical protein
MGSEQREYGLAVIEFIDTYSGMEIFLGGEQGSIRWDLKIKRGES